MTEILTLLLGGGFTAALIELIRFWRNRKAESRTKSSEAIQSELKSLEQKFELQTKHITFLEGEIEKADQRYTSQTQRLRDTQDELLQAKSDHLETRECNKRMALQLQRERCETLDCPYRVPPTAWTPPPADKTIEQHYAEPDSLEKFKR